MDYNKIIKDLENEIKKDKLDLKRYIYNGIITILVLFFLLGFFVFLHEFLHGQVFYNFGCTEIKYNWGFFESSTLCLNRITPLTEAEALAHSLVELFSYLGLYLVIFSFVIKRLKWF